MPRMRYTPLSLKIIATGIIPFAIFCGFLGLTLGTFEVSCSPPHSCGACWLLMLVELIMVSAISHLTYRMVLLRLVGDSEGWHQACHSLMSKDLREIASFEGLEYFPF